MKIGVVIGRFHLNQLKYSHRSLIDAALRDSDKVVVLVGSAWKPPSFLNPLPVELRMKIIWDTFTKDPLIRKKLSIFPLVNVKTNEEWSSSIDCLLKATYGNHDYTLWHGPKSGILGAYKGIIKNFKEMNFVDSDASQYRETLTKFNCPPDELDAKSIIWTTQNQFGRAFPTVDIAIFDKGWLVVFKKPGEIGYRFPGGFVDPTDDSLEHAARREAMEETGLEVTDPVYIKSIRINDSRYRDEREKIITSLFMCKKMFGVMKAADDMKDSEILLINPDQPIDIMNVTHQPLFAAVKEAKREFLAKNGFL